MFFVERRRVVADVRVIEPIRRAAAVTSIGRRQSPEELTPCIAGVGAHNVLLDQHATLIIQGAASPISVRRSLAASFGTVLSTRVRRL